MDRHSCRLCLKKGKVALVDALLIPELCKSVKCFFGFEILHTDRCSTKICVECVTQITDALGYKNRVLYNQDCVKKEQILHAQIQSIKIEDNEEDDDVMIIEEKSSPRPQEDSQQVSSSGISPVTITCRQTARKSTTKLPYHVPPPRPTTKELCPKRLKIVCNPICDEDVSKVRISKKTQNILKVKGKMGKSKSKGQRKSRNSLPTDGTNRRTPLVDQMKQIISESPKATGSQSATKKLLPLKPKPPETIIVLPRSPAKGNNLPRGGNNTSCKSNVTVATVGPSDANPDKVIWCSVPTSAVSKEPRSGQNNATVNKQSNAQNVSFNYLAKYLAKSVTKANARAAAKSIGSPKSSTPGSASKGTKTTPVTTSTPLSSFTCNTSGMPVGSPSNSTTQNSNSASNAAAVYLSSPMQQNVVGTIYVGHPPGGLAASSTPLRTNGTIPGTVEIARGIYPYMPEKQYAGASPVRYILPATANPLNTSMNTSRPPQAYPPPQMLIPNKSENNLSGLPIDLLDSSLNLNKVKVLTVNELNTRASQQPPTSVAPPKSQRLPIRISLTRMRNEMVIKLSDAQGNEMTYSDLDASEKVAVRTSLLSKESIRQFGQAFQTCSPDEYTTGLLNTLGLSKATFASVVL